MEKSDLSWINICKVKSIFAYILRKIIYLVIAEFFLVGGHLMQDRRAKTEVTGKHHQTQLVAKLDYHHPENREIQHTATLDPAKQKTTKTNNFQSGK